MNTFPRPRHALLALCLAAVLLPSSALAQVEDRPHVSGVLGTVPLGVRKDTAASLADADGDYTAPIYDASGRQWVHVGAMDGALTITGVAQDASVDGLEALLTTQAGYLDGVEANQATGNASLATVVTNTDGIETALGTLNTTLGTPLQAGGTVTANLGTLGGAALDTSVDGVEALLAGTLTVDGSGVTQPVSAASLPLPAGAATSALQDDVYGPVTPATATATSSVLGGCAYNSTAPTFTNGQQGSVQCGTRGATLTTLMASNSTSALSSGSPSDALGSSLTSLNVNSFALVYDPTSGNYVRQQNVVDGLDDTGVGLSAAGLAGQLDDVSTSAVTENRFANVRITAGRALLVSEAGSGFTNITTNTDTSIKASAGTLVRITVNTAGLTSAVAVYNDADGTCSSGLIGTFSTLAQTSLTINAAATTGICVTTTGGTPADITILWR